MQVQLNASLAVELDMTRTNGIAEGIVVLNQEGTSSKVPISMHWLTEKPDVIVISDEEKKLLLNKINEQLVIDASCFKAVSLKC